MIFFQKNLNRPLHFKQTVCLGMLFLLTVLPRCSVSKESESNLSHVNLENNHHPARLALVENYLHEFASEDFTSLYPKIYQALKVALTHLPQEVFVQVTDRKRPILIVPAISSGIARFARSTEFTIQEDDPPTFTEGVYLIILGDELNAAEDIQSIEGIILHEIAHRYLEHLKEDFSCEMEREANQLVKSWGFEEVFAKARETFGSKSPADSPCQE